MIGETYLFFSYGTEFEYIFESTGRNGVILKYVQFYEKEKGVFNLGFGDLQKDGVSDTSISNNDDLQKVMNTIGQIIYHFFEKNQDAIIEMTPIDAKRSRLYHTIFQRRFSEINRIFVLEGLTEWDNWRLFELTENYQKFRLSKK